MAITWNVSVSKIGHSGSYNVSATVTDDTKPLAHQTQSMSVQGKMDTPEQKAGIYAALKAEYLKRVAEVDALAILESEAKTALEK